MMLMTECKVVLEEDVNLARQDRKVVRVAVNLL